VVVFVVSSEIWRRRRQRKRLAAESPESTSSPGEDEGASQLKATV
jgi:hypothetical protein